jgi:hypothetical protein
MKGILRYLTIVTVTMTLVEAQFLWAQELELAEDIKSHFGFDLSAGIVRLDLEVTGDGAAEIFLTNGDLWEKAGSIWHVFSPEGTSFRFLGRIRFHERFFDFKADEQLFIAMQPIQIGRFTLVEYKITSVGIEEVQRREMEEYVDRQHKSEEVVALEASFFSLFKSGRYSVSIATPEGQEVVWKDLYTHKPSIGLRRIIGVDGVAFTKAPTARRNLFDHFQGERPFRTSPSVYLLELDVTSDGVAEIILNRELRHNSLGWLVYSPSTAGYRFLGELTFDPHRIRYDAEANQLVVLRSEPKVVAYYRIDASGIRQLREVDWSMNWSRLGWPEKEKMAAWRSDVDFEILTLSVEELEKDPETAVWKELGTGGERATSVDFSLAVSGDGSR